MFWVNLHCTKVFKFLPNSFLCDFSSLEISNFYLEKQVANSEKHCFNYCMFLVTQMHRAKVNNFFVFFFFKVSLNFCLRLTCLDTLYRPGSNFNFLLKLKFQLFLLCKILMFKTKVDILYILYFILFLRKNYSIDVHLPSKIA